MMYYLAKLMDLLLPPDYASTVYITHPGIYEDMNSVIAWQHYWNATNANESLREYVHAFCFLDCLNSARQHCTIFVACLTC